MEADTCPLLEFGLFKDQASFGLGLAEEAQILTTHTNSWKEHAKWETHQLTEPPLP